MLCFVRLATGCDPAGGGGAFMLPDGVQDPRAWSTLAIDGGDGAPDDPLGDFLELVAELRKICHVHGFSPFNELLPYCAASPGVMNSP